MKKIVTLIIVILLVSALNSNKIYAQIDTAVPDEVQAAANDGFESAKRKIAGNPKKWGFTEDVIEIERLTLGEGLRVNYIAGDLSKVSGKRLDELIDPNKIETWEFTIDLDGDPKVFLTVGFEEGSYRVVQFGGIADKFGAAKNNFKNLTNEMGVTEKPILLKWGLTYFLATEINNEEFVLPVITDDNEMVFNELIPASEIIKQFKYLQENYKKGGRGSTFYFTKPTSMDAKQNRSILLPILVIGAALAAIVALLVRRYRLSLK